MYVAYDFAVVIVLGEDRRSSNFLWDKLGLQMNDRYFP